MQSKEGWSLLRMLFGLLGFPPGQAVLRASLCPLGSIALPTTAAAAATAACICLFPAHQLALPCTRSFYPATSPASSPVLPPGPHAPLRAEFRSVYANTFLEALCEEYLRCEAVMVSALPALFKVRREEGNHAGRCCV